MNSDIQRISDFLRNNKDFYFTVSYGSKSSLKESLYEPLTDKSTGEKKFTETIHNLEKYKPDYIVVKLYKKASKNFKKKPESEEKIVLYDNTPSLSGVGLEVFGGLSGFIEGKTNLAILQAENTRLINENTKYIAEIEASKKSNSDKKEKIENLIDEIRRLKWANEELERRSKNEIEEINKKNKNLDKIFTIGGTILANISGLNEDTIKGLLGLDEEKKLPEKTETNSNSDEASNKAVFKFAEDENLSEAKKKAKQLANQIDEAFSKMIELNEDTIALSIMTKLAMIFNYATNSEENLNTIYELINKN